MSELIESKELKALKQFIGAFGRKNGYKVIRIFYKNKDGLTATDVQKKIRIPQSEISNAFRLLAKHGFATSERQGKYIVYTPVYDQFDKLMDFYNLFIKTEEE